MSESTTPALLTHRVYLVRHGEVAVPADTCYGQLDCALSAQFDTEKIRLINYFRKQLNTFPASTPITNTSTWIISSPLTRCTRLATALSKALDIQAPITQYNDFQEINFGEWEGHTWQSIGEEALTSWGDNLLDYRFPSGETAREFDQRVIQGWQLLNAQLSATKEATTCIVVAHAGVIRSILSHFLHLPLQHSLLLKVDKLSVSELDLVLNNPLLSRCVGLNQRL